LLTVRLPLAPGFVSPMLKSNAKQVPDRQLGSFEERYALDEHWNALVDGRSSSFVIASSAGLEYRGASLPISLLSAFTWCLRSSGETCAMLITIAT
jgi:hypothetical protein